ncbi:DinB family protein [bacterium]|nr:DinB family protein [bacterium]
MDSSAQVTLTIANAFPAYRWNADLTDQVVSKLTDELAAWRPPSPDGKWQFSLGEIAAHIADAAHMFYGQLMGEEMDDRFFLKFPEDDSGIWKPAREFCAEDIQDHLVRARKMWEEVLAWPIEDAHAPTKGSIKHFEELKKLAYEGKYPKENLVNGPPNPVRVLGAMISHEASHRGAMIALMRSFHGIDFDTD